MSLKSFHILFITLSTITVVWFGIWELNQSVFIAMVSFLTGVGLIYYGFRVLKKFRTIS
ncbi:hypothetical protein MGWOODY_Mmi217 [hydrothermal vent metagenome]|uniref:Uncharacterized protein n=1 Tax=hydrothermal vent metagenome TaxID=652676 RepID=A0A160VGK4_9ZZZZ